MWPCTRPDCFESWRLIVGVLCPASAQVQVLQKHDAARVLQSCYRLGSVEQRAQLMQRIKGKRAVGRVLRALAHSMLMDLSRIAAAYTRSRMPQHSLLLPGVERPAPCLHGKCWRCPSRTMAISS